MHGWALSTGSPSSALLQCGIHLKKDWFSFKVLASKKHLKQLQCRTQHWSG